MKAKTPKSITMTLSVWGRASICELIKCSPSISLNELSILKAFPLSLSSIEFASGCDITCRWTSAAGKRKKSRSFRDQRCRCLFAKKRSKLISSIARFTWNRFLTLVCSQSPSPQHQQRNQQLFCWSLIIHPKKTFNFSRDMRPTHGSLSCTIATCSCESKTRLTFFLLFFLPQVPWARVYTIV